MRFCLFFCSLFLTNLVAAQTISDSLSVPERLAQQQLDAYNARDIDAFLAPYADTVKVYYFPNELSMDGKVKMREVYADMFRRTPNLHCELVNRIVMGDKVIDQERITGFGDQVFEAIAIYRVAGDRIVEVYFLDGGN